MDEDIRRNGSGYIDPTPYKAIRAEKNPGEVWVKEDGKEVLILKNHGFASSALILNDVQHGQMMEVDGTGKYCDVRYVTFVLNYRLRRFVNEISSDAFNAVYKAFTDVFAFTLADRRDEAQNGSEDALKAENEALRARIGYQKQIIEDQAQIINTNKMRIDRMRKACLYDGCDDL